MNNGHSPLKTAEVVIFGAGGMGASIAFHLAQRKPGSIIVPGLPGGHVDRLS
jgi:shikimate 5-dehydrogenase